VSGAWCQVSGQTLSLKRLNSSAKSEFIRTLGISGVNIDNHLPGGFEDGLWSQTLPILEVEGPIHFREPAVALHRKSLWLASHNSF